MSDPRPGYEPVLLFPDQSPSFAHGFVCGQIWQQMKDNVPLINEMVLSEARPTIEAMVMNKGWQETFDDVGDGWLHVWIRNPAFPEAPG